jgi:uncharacterized membrane protein
MTANVHAVLFDDQRSAEDMLENVNTWVEKGWLKVDDAVVVSRGVGSEGPPTSMVPSANGERPIMLPGATGSSDIEIKQTTKSTGKFALGGGGIGLIAGMLLGGPIGGLVVGATVGAITGALRDSGIDDKFIKEVSTGLAPGTSILFLMTSGGDEQKIFEELRPFKARLLKTTLSPERERALRDALERK